MSTMMMLYIILQLDAVLSWLNGIAWIGIIVLFLSGLASAIFVSEHLDEKEEFPKQLKYIIVSSILAVSLSQFASIFIPTTNKAALMVVGSKMLDSNATNILSNIPEKYAKILNEKANKYLEETLKESKNAN